MARTLEVNIAGLSSHSATAPSIYLTQEKPQAVSLTETRRIHHSLY